MPHDKIITSYCFNNYEFAGLPSLTSTGVLFGLLVVSEFDLVGEVVVQVEVLLLGEGVAGDGLEGELDVDGLLGARLEIGHLGLALAPLLGALRRHRPVLQINLKDDK